MDLPKCILEFLVFLLIAGLLLLVLLCLFMYGLYLVFKPQTPESQLNEFSANLLEYKFSEGYEILDSESNNSHPDRPQDLAIRLSEEELVRLKTHIDTLPEEIRNKKGKTGYVRKITKSEDGCIIQHSSIHLKIDYVFFTATANVDYSTRTITFHSTFY